MSDTSPGHRQSLSLDGEWEFVTDPNDTGGENEWMASEASWPGRSRIVEVPVAWEELDEFRQYTGRAWYRRSFEVGRGATADSDAILRFGAVDYETTVWVNGEHVGDHRDGFLPFELDVTDALVSGENTVVVSVTDPDDLSEIPHGKQGDPWYTRVSGIWQSVSVDFRPPARVTDLKVTPDIQSDTATVEAEISPDTYDRDDLRCEISASKNDTVVSTATTEAHQPVETALEFDSPDYWRPDDPNLYDVEVRLCTDDEILDRTTDYFGFRSFTSDGEQFYLNGEPITLRGVLEQGYYPKTLYRPPSAETFDEEIETAKELGFNLIRKHLKPAHPEFLERADRQGILVWEEPANPTIYTDQSREAVRDEIHNIVERDYNRPSVVIWSLYNEEWGIGHADNEETLWTDESKQRFLADQCRELRQKDPTRLVCDNSGWAHVVTDINDFHRYFVSPDRATGWEDDLDYICTHPDDNWATKKFEDTSAPIVLSELGTWGLCDIPALRDEYGGDPSWFDHEFLEERLKRPQGVDSRFAASDLPDVFGDYETLADHWQRREFVSLKHILEELRTREAVAGYVLTELSDIEWEFNGLLDYRREPKNFYDDFASVNAPVTLVADLNRHAVWNGTTIEFDVTLVNDTGEELSGSVEWSFADRRGTAPLDAPPHSVTSLDESARLDIQLDDDIVTSDLTLAFETETQRVETREPITVVSESSATPMDALVYAEGGIASRLARRGVNVTHTLEKAAVALTDRLTDDVMAFANEGGAVVHLPGDDGHMDSAGPFTYHRIPERESWIEAASFLYQDSPHFAGVCETPRLGWSLERMYPYHVATDLDANEDTIHAGYVEGWLANWSSPLVTRSHGSGSLTACTFRLVDSYGDHPVGTLLIDRLLDEITNDEPPVQADE